MRRDPKVIVVGAGIGGLTAAIAMKHFGFDVMVLEQADELGEVGAGVQLAPNAMKVLRALGVEDQALAVSFEPERHVIRSWKSGRLVSATPLKGALDTAYGAGYYGFHRADLHRVLCEAMPPESIRLSARCDAVVEAGDVVRVRLADGTELEADAVVGADGIHSAVRTALLGPESPRFTGHVCWRGLVPADAMPKGAVPPDMTVWFGPGANIVQYYVRGGELINWVASYEASDWHSESWRVQGDRNEVIERFRQWHPTVRQLLSLSDRYYKWALFDRDPLPRWSVGRATLLGDAAHPMLPYLAQGACMAVEDGYAVAASLAQTRGDVRQAFLDYEEQRRERTARVQLLARSRGVENNLASPLARLARDIKFAWKRRAEPGKHAYGIEWIYGHDVTRSA